MHSLELEKYHGRYIIFNMFHSYVSSNFFFFLFRFSGTLIKTVRYFSTFLLLPNILDIFSKFALKTLRVILNRHFPSRGWGALISIKLSLKGMSHQYQLIGRVIKDCVPGRKGETSSSALPTPIDTYLRLSCD